MHWDVLTTVTALGASATALANPATPTANFIVILLFSLKEK
jgi:hypothetical protein